jgi:translin
MDELADEGGAVNERVAIELGMAALRQEAEAMHAAREQGLALCRRLIQNSAKSIRATHRGEADEAAARLAEAREISAQARAALREHPALFFAGYLQDAEKELVEAAAVRAVAAGEPAPLRDELGVSVFTYLHGMGEAASELRRYALDASRRGETELAERILDWMESVYDELIGFDFADGMTGGLRRTTDALRAVIERTRSDLTATAVQQQLIAELRKTEGLLTRREG